MQTRILYKHGWTSGSRAWQCYAPSPHCRHREIGKAPVSRTARSIIAVLKGGRVWRTLGTPIGIMVTGELRAQVRCALRLEA